MSQPVLVLVVLILAAGVDEQHLVISLVAFEDQDRRRNAGAEEQVGGQADHRIEQVLLDQLLADFAFSGAAEQHAMRHDHADPPGVLGRGFDHVRDEGVIALGLWRHAAMEALVRVVARFVMAPFVERERRIGDHHVELHGAVVFDQFRVADRVAPFDAGVVHAVQEHVHFRQRPGCAVGFLAVESEVLDAALK